MMLCQLFNIVGVILQVCAAAFIVIEAWRTAGALEGVKGNNLDALEGDIRKLGGEMRRQFRHQLIAFIALAVGAVLQLICPIRELIC